MHALTKLFAIILLLICVSSAIAKDSERIAQIAGLTRFSPNSGLVQTAMQHE
jgi:hypothetical protein